MVVLTGFNGVFGLSSSPDGAYMYASNNNTASIDKITVATNEVQKDWATDLNGGAYSNAVVGDYW